MIQRRAISDEELAIVASIAVAAYVFWKWIKAGTVKRDPWDSSVAEALASNEAGIVCPHCLEPLTEGQRDCPHCGASVGLFTACDPFAQMLSGGVVLGAGVAEPGLRKGTLLIGFWLLPLHYFGLLAPVYWFFLVKNYLRSRFFSNL